MEYKVVVVMGNQVGSLEDMLNNYALSGYRVVNCWDNNSRLIVIMERPYPEALIPNEDLRIPVSVGAIEITAEKPRQRGWPKGKSRTKPEEDTTINLTSE